MVEMLSGYEIEFLMRLILSLAFGFVIGTERESRGKSAGISTQSLVIGGSMIFTYISSTLFSNSSPIIAAQIVTGVGFLGAGIIMKQKAGKVSNLTTAASIWFSASIGMALGFGMYAISVMAVIYSVFVPRIPHMSVKKR